MTVGEVRDVGENGVKAITPLERKQKQRDNQDYFSAKVSDLARAIGYGLVAVSFTLISTDSKFFQSLSSTQKQFIITSAAFGCLTALFDFLQYLFGFLAASQAVENIDGDYRQTQMGKLFRWFQECFFWLKQGGALIGVLLLISAVVWRLLV